MPEILAANQDPTNSDINNIEEHPQQQPIASIGNTSSSPVVAKTTKINRTGAASTQNINAAYKSSGPGGMSRYNKDLNQVKRSNVGQNRMNSH